MSATPGQTRSFCALWTGGSQSLVQNLRAQVATQAVAETDLPVTLADGQHRPNCYICQPSTAYIDYGIAETRHFTSAPMLQGALIALLRAARPLVRASGLDHQAQINNWLLATNPPPPADILAAMRALAKQHTDRAIVLRSVNDATDAGLLTQAKAAGFTLLPARQVWLWHPGTRQTRDRRRDKALLTDGQFETLEGPAFTPADFDTAAALYGQLYLQKYTPLNPQYTAAFLRGMVQAGLMRLTGICHQGTLLGVVGTVSMGGMLTAPVVGYRTDLPQTLALYRRLLALAMAEAEGANIPFHMSAGAASFKRNRGALPAIEYTVALTTHLPLRNRVAAATLAALLRRIGIPIMRKYAL